MPTEAIEGEGQPEVATSTASENPPARMIGDVEGFDPDWLDQVSKLTSILPHDGGSVDLQDVHSFVKYLRETPDVFDRLMMRSSLEILHKAVESARQSVGLSDDGVYDALSGDDDKATCLSRFTKAFLKEDSSGTCRASMEYTCRPAKATTVAPGAQPA